jgi:hypothetical protein
MSKPKKAPTVKPAKASSIFGGVQTSNVALPGFGTGSTTISGDANNRTINTSFNPDAQISSIMGKAKQGIEDNQNIFNLTPEQQFAQIESNPYYQYQKGQNASFLKQGQADARQSASQTGLENSTIAGAIEASLLKDASQMDLQARLGANDYSRGIAAQNLGLQQGILDQIYGFSSEPLAMSNQTFMGAGENQDQVGMFNAGQIQQANLQNAQMRFQQQQQQAQQRSALIGNIIKAGAAIAAAPFTGGTSLIGAGLSSAGSFLKR